MSKTAISLYKKLLVILGVLALLSPIGLLASGDAWGEWSKETLAKMLGYVPYGIEKFSDIWKAPFTDYTLKGTSDALGYIASAIIGSLLVMAFIYIIGKLLSKNK